MNKLKTISFYVRRCFSPTIQYNNKIINKNKNKSSLRFDYKIHKRK